MIAASKKQKVLAKAHRFEVRCSPAFRQLAEKLRELEGVATFAEFFRKLVVETAIRKANRGSLVEADAKALRELVSAVEGEDE